MVKKKHFQRQLVGSAFREETRGKRVEKSTGKGECNAQAHRRFVYTYARGESSEEALRSVGGALEKAAESREGEISEEADGETASERTSQTKRRFSYSASKGVKPNQRNWSAIPPPPPLSTAKIDPFLKKKKKEKKKNSREIRRSQTLRSKTIVRFKDRSKRGKICESKKKKKRGREIRQSAERKVRYYPG